MKKLITFGTICIIACICFSSCTSNIAITKRRYNKGYYIDRSSSKQMALITKEKPSQAIVAAPIYPSQELAVQSAKPGNSIQVSKTENINNATNAGKPQHKAILATNAGSMIKNLPVAVEAPLLQTGSAISAVRNIAENDHSSRDALSLFWLIILIILIVWVIGLIAGGWGLGGFINVLLVVALILLILWLLRII